MNGCAIFYLQPYEILLSFSKSMFTSIFDEADLKNFGTDSFAKIIQMDWEIDSSNIKLNPGPGLNLQTFEESISQFI